MTGIQIASQDRGSPVKNMAAPLGLMAGLGIPALSGALSGGLPQILGEMLGRSIVVGAVTVMLAEIVLVRAPDLLRSRQPMKWRVGFDQPAIPQRSLAPERTDEIPRSR